MKVIDIDINKLIPYEKNPRKNDGAVEPVANSIREFGFKVPLVIDKENNVVCGHTRLKAAKKLGMKIVPCIIADDLSEEQVKAFRLSAYERVKFLFNTILRERQLITYMKIKGCQIGGDN